MKRSGYSSGTFKMCVSYIQSFMPTHNTDSLCVVLYNRVIFPLIVQQISVQTPPARTEDHVAITTMITGLNARVATVI